jgi:carboxylesterase type B
LCPSPTLTQLQVFGFAQTDALKQQVSENAGVRDQRLAIEWVKENIEAFGGDPDRITIHGQSSGGLAIGIQMVAYGNSKPYPMTQAIGQSQILEPDITGNVTRHATARVWRKTSCTKYSFDSVENAACLRQQPMEVRRPSIVR